MRPRSNPVALMLAMIVGLSVTSVSCSPESTSPAGASAEAAPSVVQTAQSLQEQYAWTGKYHNDALTYAMSKIKEGKQVSKLEKCKVGLSALKDFQKAFRKAGGNAVFDDLTITDGMCEAAGSVSNRVVSTKSLDPQARAASADISYLANDYLNQISYQVDVAPSVEYLASAVSKIGSQAVASVSSLEAGAVLTSGSIAVNSANYWTVNEATTVDNGPAPYARSSNRTIDIPDDLTPRAMMGVSSRARRIIKADVAAAIGVLLKEWFTGEAAVAKACITAAAASLIAGIYFT